MSIGPVGNSVPVPEPQSPERKPPAAPGATPVPESSPNREASAAKPASSPPASPQDEVKVQWDTPMADYIEIYQFVNQQSGSLILQEPNEQVLSVIHAIQQIPETARQRAAAPPNPDGKED